MTQPQDQGQAHSGQAACDTDGSLTPVNVAWLSRAGTLEGLVRVLGPLAVGLADELVNITLFRANGAPGGDVLGPGVETICYRRRRFFGPGARTVADLGETVRARKIDLLHALDAGSAGLASALARVAGVKYLLSSYHTGDGAALGTLGSDCAGVLASSTAIRNDLVEHHVSAAEKIHLARPGVYHVRYPGCFSRSGRSVAIVAGGPMDAYGAWDAVLRTFAELRMREFDCEFFVVCSGRGERRTRRLARDLDLLGHVTFIDRTIVSQFSGIIKSADVYISAAPDEKLDIRALLAMANGSAVLAAADAAADFIIDGQTALTFEQGNHAELTTKLVAMLDDPAAARALAAVALAYVAEHHSPAASVTALSETYRSAAAQADRTESQ